MGGISGLLGALALLGFLGFLGGIGLVVVAASQGRPVRGGIMLAVLGLVVGLLFSVISQGILIVEPTEVAVIVNTLSGQLDPTPRRGGTHIILPVVQQAFRYSLIQQTVTMEGQTPSDLNGDVIARTSDGQEVRLDVSVIFRIDPENVNQLHLTWQGRYQNDFVIPTARGIVRDAVSQFEAAEIYAGGRETLSDTAFNRLRESITRDGLTLSDMIIRNITFSSIFSDAIEQAQVAAQEAERARLQVSQRTAEAEQLLAQAQGERNAEIARAEGEAQAIVLRAQAEAEALRLVSEQIAANPSLIQYLYVQNLSDNVNIALVPSNSPFLFDFASLGEANADFRAPAIPDAQMPAVDPTPVP